MARIEIKHDPDLTKEKLLKSFQRHFDGKYHVYPTKVLNAHFVVKRSAAAGVFVRLIQKNGKTNVICRKCTPSWVLRTPIGIHGVLGAVLYGNARSSVLRDVVSFLESYQSFDA